MSDILHVLSLKSADITRAKYRGVNLLYDDDNLALHGCLASQHSLFCIAFYTNSPAIASNIRTIARLLTDIHFSEQKSS